MSKIWDCENEFWYLNSRFTYGGDDLLIFPVIIEKYIRGSTFVFEWNTLSVITRTRTIRCIMQLRGAARQPKSAYSLLYLKIVITVLQNDL